MLKMESGSTGPGDHEKVIRKCLNCSYERTSKDVEPASECPQCGAIYEKMEQHFKPNFKGWTKEKPKSAPESPRLLVIASVVAALIIAYLIIPPLLENMSLDRTAISQTNIDNDEKLSATMYGITRTSISCKTEFGKRGALKCRVTNEGSRTVASLTVALQITREPLVPNMTLDEALGSYDFETIMVDIDGPFEPGKKKNIRIEYPEGVEAAMTEVTVEKASF